MLNFGYNTNGFAHHRLEDACTIIAEIGYRSVAVTVERDLLPSMDSDSVGAASCRLNEIRRSTGLCMSLETGSRFYLDPRRKHQPTVLSFDSSARSKRVEFVKACIDVAAGTGSHCVSLWSGTPDSGEDDGILEDRLVEGLREILVHARHRNVRIGFEPEPGMFVATMGAFERLHDRLGDALFGLTLDLGHVHCLNDGDPAGHLRRWTHKLWNVHIEDMHRGAHEHLMFGDGDMPYAPIFAALREINCVAPVHVELSRHSHNAVEAARQAFAFLSRF